MLATCHFDFLSKFRMISLFAFILYYSPPQILFWYTCQHASNPVLSVGLCVISSGSVGTTPGPEAMLCSLSAVVWSTLVCRGHFEEGGHNNDALTHQWVAQAVWQFPQCIQICVIDTCWIYNEQTEALRQLHNRYHRGATKAQALAGCFSPLRFTAAAAASGLAPTLISSRTGYGGNTVGLRFQTW